MNSLPNLKPTRSGAGRLAIITECPSKDDLLKCEPFSSSSGGLLKSLLSAVGVVPQECFFGYIYNRPAPYGTIVKRKGREQVLSVPKTTFNESMQQLVSDLDEFNPNCILLLGTGSLKIFGGTYNLDNFRGSLFVSPFLNRGWKCVASYTALHCFQKYIDSHLLKFDMYRAAEESYTKSLELPKRDLTIATDLATAFNYLNKVTVEGTLVGYDVEGYPDAKGITCFSFALSGEESCVIPLRKMNGQSVFTPSDEVLIWEKHCEILSNPNVAKICQNAMYELFIMAWRHGIVIANIADDTMLKHWELYQEFSKNLGLQTSLYTREPYFKFGRKANSDEGHWEYNAKDSAILLDINETQDMLLDRHGNAKESYQFRLELLKPYTYMSLKGCLIDRKQLERHRIKLEQTIVETQAKIETAVGRPINAKSHVDKKWLLYDYMKFDKVYKGRGAEKKLSADEETILKCKQRCINPIHEEILGDLLTLIKARTDFSDSYKLEPFRDGRIRCSYNPVGTETGRISSSSTSVRDTITIGQVVRKKDKTEVAAKTKTDFLGTNLQNVSKWIRDVFIADPGCSFWQYDFSGADAWTVAADVNALGNPHMLEHLQQGIKPSCVILMMRKYGVEVMHWSVDKILEVQPEMKNAGKMYVCAKACQHGSNYGMGPTLLADTIFKRSNGEIQITPKIAQDLQNAYEAYYQVSLRTKWVQSQLNKFGYLETASGSRRRFLEIRNRGQIDQQVLRKALSFEPQNNTTHATNMALHRLYYSEDNRDGNKLKIQPLLMIHDALAGQVPDEHIEWAKTYLPDTFKVTLNIHDQQITIPAEGGFAPNWKSID